ncbi:unnamed protein product [marine sediment metagenome]|uniref:Uncharacterized protein n=1 Tax=marine sediment metagenome TaxID=412755 RepID=X0TJT6_9ZZZZ
MPTPDSWDTWTTIQDGINTFAVHMDPQGHHRRCYAFHLFGGTEPYGFQEWLRRRRRAGKG